MKISQPMKLKEMAYKDLITKETHGVGVLRSHYQGKSWSWCIKISLPRKVMELAYKDLTSKETHGVSV